MHKLKIGQIIQVKPDTLVSKCFWGCLAIIEEVRDWGVVCYVSGVGESFEEWGGRFYLRLKFEDFEATKGMITFQRHHRDNAHES